MRYRNKWTDVPDIDIKEQDSDKYVDNMKSEFDNIWKEFILHAEKHPDICDKGIINEKRLPSPKNDDEEAIRKIKIDTFIESLEVKDITEILWSVHEKTGFLDSFKIMISFINNMLSRFHYRKGRMGVTIYWFVRNDWIANYVKVIGNDEWESWYVIDGLLNSYCDKEVRQSCGDTQGQLLSLWGIGALLGLDIRARFRVIKNVNLYKSSENCQVEPLKYVGSIDWNIIKKCLPSVMKLANAVKSRKRGSKDFLSTWNIYDENGVNVAEGLREIGKIYRTKFILKYLMNEELQQDIREGCNRAEFWNKFQDAVFGERIENDLDGVTMHPAFWQYINFIGKYSV
jgi:hypothetical protein